jgi:3-hydroxyacyl-CoA dehydrogenase / enoyl-CoA hydratase / 3-hydroxybutyryl-CoA epimerase
LSTDTQTAVRYERDADGIVTLTLDDPNQSANTMNELYISSMKDVVDRLYDEQDSDNPVTGVVIASAKKTFFAGGDLKTMVQTTKENAAEVFAQCEKVKAALRRLELFPKPVVAAINGAALGGGLEICLAANHRILVDDPSVKVGLPEVSLGLLPGGGGVTRTVRMFGIQTALMDVLLQGTQFNPGKAKEKGIVDELVASREELVPAAKAWIANNAANPDASVQPWDAPGYKMPGGTPKSPALAAFLPAFPALLRTQTKGAVYPAARAILSAAIEGANTDFDTASRIESRYLTNLVVNQGSKNMIQAFFFDLQAINSGSLRPGFEKGLRPSSTTEFPKWKATKVGVLGAGMMGAGIAYVCAKAGMEVVLKDVAVENAEKGKAYSEGLLDKAISRGRSTEEKKAELLGRITATANPEDLTGCDLVIEAVFEDPSLKAEVFAEVAPFIDKDALLCSNTSTLPITQLAEGVDRNWPSDDSEFGDLSTTKRFIGLHFFSPVDKMPLVEIITGKETNDVALAKAYDVVQQIRKTPIVVNDSRGFYTSRVIGYMVNEGMAMLAEGVAPYSIERATLMAGYPAAVLQLSDELNLELMAKIAKATKEGELASGNDYVGHPGTEVVDKMLEAGRAGRLRGGGFYDYEDGKRGSIWAGLAELFPVAEEQPPLADVMDRMMFAEALETAKCFEEGVITSAAAANIGSIMGIGFPPMTGGAAQFMTGYELKDRTGETLEIGLNAFLKRADDLAAKYGDRFQATPWLRDLAASGGSFPA